MYICVYPGLLTVSTHQMGCTWPTGVYISETSLRSWSWTSQTQPLGLQLKSSKGRCHSYLWIIRRGSQLIKRLFLLYRKFVCVCKFILKFGWSQEGMRVWWIWPSCLRLQKHLFWVHQFLETLEMCFVCVLDCQPGDIEDDVRLPWKESRCWLISERWSRVSLYDPSIHNQKIGFLACGSWLNSYKLVWVSESHTEIWTGRASLKMLSFWDELIKGYQTSKNRSRHWPNHFFNASAYLEKPGEISPWFQPPTQTGEPKKDGEFASGNGWSVQPPNTQYN